MAHDQTKRDDMPALSFSSYRVLLPALLGIACSSSTVNLVVRAAHRSADIAAPNGMAAIIAALAIGVLFLVTLRVRRFSKRVISAMTFLAIHAAGLACLATGCLAVLGVSAPSLALTLLHAAVLVGSTLLQFYWLRKLRGTSAQAVVIVVFGALALAETVTFIGSLLTEAVRAFLGIGFTFAQFACIRTSRALDAPSDWFPAVSESYFGTDEDQFSSRSFLVFAAMGIWFISIPLGMGRGFPAGTAVYLSTVPRFLLLLFVWIVSVMWVRFGLASRMRALTTSIWVAIQILLSLGAIFYAIWPHTIGIGGSFVMGAALVLTAFIWYLTIAFISFGWRDPYYYASAAWIAFQLLTCAGIYLDRVLFTFTAGNRALIIALVGFFTLASAQLVFTRLLFAPSERREREDAQRAAQQEHVQTDADAARMVPGAPTGSGTDECTGADGTAAPRHLTQDDVRRIPLMGVMALSPQTTAPLPHKTPDVHIATSVVAMGQRFGLTGREVEVLTLYALGHTQARVSEELQLSQNTVHTHIKRIYEKTDLHSRQEILDYISEYGTR